MEDAHFGPNAILRGAQLTIVGAHRALQNPNLFTSDHYRQAGIAVLAGLVIRILVSIPTASIRIALWFLGFVVDLGGTNWDDELIEGLEFIEHSVLQAPFFLMTLMRYVTPTLDNVFMESLEWVDRTYIKKHKSEDPSGLRAMFYPNLVQYGHQGKGGEAVQKKSPKDAITLTLFRFGRKAAISLAIYLLSFVPYVGKLVLPLASFYTFRQAVGLQPAAVIFGTSILLPKRYIVMFLQSYFASRTLMRELLVPYFQRLPFTTAQKRQWFKDREGVLFGFAITFTLFLRIPLVGVLIYGIAEASTAFLVTKITDPPPPPAEALQGKWVDGQVRWRNKHEFLSLPLAALDALNVDEKDKDGQAEKKKRSGSVQSYPSKKFS